MSLMYAKICKKIQVCSKMIISIQRMTNVIKGQLYLHVFDIKQAYLLILGKKLIICQLTPLVYASSWKIFSNHPKLSLHG